jgi:hypothetical protein
LPRAGSIPAFGIGFPSLTEKTTYLLRS